MAVSKKLRFEVFRRDNFACRYCGKSAQDGAILEPDHVTPVSRGGRDAATNLVTACLECNSGKSDTPFTAPPIADVPQEAFRRSCAERGIADVPFTYAPDEPTTLAQEIRSNYFDSQWEEFAASVRSWMDDDEHLTEEEFAARVAYDAFLEEMADRCRLERVVRRLLDLFPREEMSPQYDAADEQFRSVATDSTVQERPAAWLARVAILFLEERERSYFADLSDQERAEWMQFALSRSGSSGPDDPWRMSDEEHLKRAAHLAFSVNAGYFYPSMCSARGEHIRFCAQRAKHRVRFADCHPCVSNGEPGCAGHNVCDAHLTMLLDGGYVRPDGITLKVAEHAEIKARD
jgi:hypothetical protein